MKLCDLKNGEKAKIVKIGKNWRTQKKISRYGDNSR